MKLFIADAKKNHCFNESKNGWDKSPTKY